MYIHFFIQQQRRELLEIPGIAFLEWLHSKGYIRPPGDFVSIFFQPFMLHGKVTINKLSHILVEICARFLKLAVKYSIVIGSIRLIVNIWHLSDGSQFLF